MDKLREMNKLRENPERKIICCQGNDFIYLFKFN